MTDEPGGSTSAGGSDGITPLIRHLLATLAYRTRKAVRGAPDQYGSYSAGAGSRSPVEIVCHMTSLLVFSRGILADRSDLRRPAPLTGLEDEVARFHRELERLGDALTSRPSVDPDTANRLLQGPLADALTHVGQLALLRRLAGSPVPPEDFSRADIRSDRLGIDQADPVRPRPRDERIRRALEWVSGLLEELSIPFQVAGGLAAVAHGATRILQDIDIYVPSGALWEIRRRVTTHEIRGPRRVRSERWDCLLLEVRHSGEEIELADAERTRYRGGEGEPWFEADVDFEKAIRLEVFGVELPVMPLDDLVRYKRRIGRDVDLHDVAELTARSSHDPWPGREEDRDS